MSETSDENLQDGQGWSLPSELTSELEAIQEPKSSDTITRQLGEIIESLDNGQLPPESAELSQMLVDAHASDQAETNAQMPKLRSLRIAGSKYRQNLTATVAVDLTIVELLLDGQTELVKQLVSSAGQEQQNLDHAVGIEVKTKDPAKAAELKASFGVLIREKRKNLTAHLQDIGMSADTIAQIVFETDDPDSAMGVSAQTWEKFPKDDSFAQEALTKTGTDIEQTINIVNQVNDHGLTEFGDRLLPQLLSKPGPDERDKYMESFASVRDKVRDGSETDKSQDDKMVISEFVAFVDPARAYVAAKSLYGEKLAPADVINFRIICQEMIEGTTTHEITPEQLSVLITVKNALGPVQPGTQPLEIIAGQLRQEKHLKERAEHFARSFEFLREMPKEFQNQFINIAYSQDTAHIPEALRKLQPFVSADELKSSSNMLEAVISSPDSPGTADLLALAYPILKSNDMDFAEMPPGEILSIYRPFEMPEVKLIAEIKRRCSDRVIARQAVQAFSLKNNKLAAGQTTETVRPELEDIPELKLRLADMGLTEELSQKTFEAWSTFDSVKKYLSDLKSWTHEISADEYTSLTFVEAQRVKRQFTAVSDFGARHGNDELREVMEIFGIKNFLRYYPGQLHSQYEQWKAGIKPAEEIAISAEADWNGALDNVGETSDSAFKGKNTFVFEVGSKLDIAQALIKVGKREVANGRDPEKDGFVKDVLIDAHGNPAGLLLGSDGERLSYKDYVDTNSRTPAINTTVNTYRRHLGNNFRIILNACSTGGRNLVRESRDQPLKQIPNIAETIATQHQTRVESSPVSTIGSITIEPNGQVLFDTFRNGTDKQAATAATTYDYEELLTESRDKIDSSRDDDRT